MAKLDEMPEAASAADRTRVRRAEIAWDKFVVPAIFLLLCAIFGWLDIRFLSGVNLANILNQVSIMMVVTVAASLVVFTGGFDLSAGSVVALAGVVAALVVEHTGGVAAGVAAGIAAGAAVGLANGFFVGFLNVSPLIVTLGTLNVARGLALVAAGGTAVYSFPAWYTDFGTSRVLGVPVLFLVALGVYGAFAFLLRFTTFGVNVYATGGNAQAARLSGIDTRLVRLAAFGAAGAIAGVAGLMLCARTGGGEPSAGLLYELEAIAAVVLGGAALSGGEGRLWRSMLGILLLTVLGNGLNIVGVHPYWKGVAIGSILIAAASLDAVRRA